MAQINFRGFDFQPESTHNFMSNPRSKTQLLSDKNIQDFEPKEFQGVVTKLGKWQWSQNQRFLKVDSVNLSYFKKEPQPGPYQKPAFSVPVDYIDEISELAPQEKAKFKKAFAEGHGTFKVQFDAEALVKGDYYTQHKLTDNPAELDDSKQKEFSKKRDIWYFSTGADPDNTKRNEWLLNLAAFAQNANPKVNLSEQVHQLIQQAKIIQSKKENVFDPQKIPYAVPNEISQNKKRITNVELNAKPPENHQKLIKDNKTLKQQLDPIFEDNQNINIQSKKVDYKNRNDTIGNNKANELGVSVSSNIRDQSFQKVCIYKDKEIKHSGVYGKKESLGWDLKFQNYWGNIRKADQEKEIKSSDELSEKFISHIGDFRKTSQKIVMEIINDLHKQKKDQKHKEITPQNSTETIYQAFQDEDNNAAEKSKFFYDEQLTHKIIIKLTNIGNTYHDEPTDKDSQDVNGTQVNNESTNRSHQNYKHKTERYWWKRFGREFLSFDIMFDALYVNSKQNDTHILRIPLVCMVDYKGFRAICIANVCIDNTLQPALGFYQEKYSCQDENLKQALRQVGDSLNLKDNKLLKKGFSQQFEIIPVSSLIKIYTFNASQDDGNEKKDGGLDSPTMKNWFLHHFGELVYTNNPMYVIQTSEIFPYDWEITEVPNTNKVLRPEFVCQYERPLKSDTKKNVFKKQQIQDHYRKAESLNFNKRKNESNNYNNMDTDADQNDVMELNEASRQLRRNNIQQLVDLLDSLIIVPIDSQSLEQVFHIQGVNMRYLGYVAYLSTSPHVQDICITEMFARTLKRIFNTQCSQNILLNQENLTNIATDLAEVNECLKNLAQPENTPQYISDGKGANPNSKLNPAASYQELEERQRMLIKEQEELNGEMDQNIKGWTHDFMNLIFGLSQEKKIFWEQILLNEVRDYYIYYPLEELANHEIRLNALYFALIDLIGLECKPPKQQQQSIDLQRLTQNQQSKNQKHTKNFEKQDEESFFKLFGKVESPFGDNENRYEFEYVAKTRTYELRTIPYTLESNRFQEYKDNDQIGSAIKCCQMRFNQRYWLHGNKVAVQETNTDLCQIYLEKGRNDLAKQYASEALSMVHPMHASAIKFYCILMQAFYLDDELPQADVYFTTSLSILDHHWGPFHPMHVSIYGIMAQLLIEKNKLDDAKYLYQASLLCCMRLLGPNHIQTGEVHMDFGKLYLKKQEKRESLQHFTEAYLIYESYFGTTALQTAEAASNISKLLEEQKRLLDAHKYAEAAAKTYQNVYSSDNPNTIKVLWQLLTISYELKHPQTEDQANQLLKLLIQRDNQNPPYDQTVEDLKIMVVATIIMEVTRKESIDDKKLIKAFCDKLLFYKKLAESQARHEEIIPSLIDYHGKDIDPLRIATIKNLNFPIKGKDKLKEWYLKSAKNASDQNNDDGQTYFLRDYKSMLQQIKEKELNHIKKQLQIQAAATIARTMEDNNLNEEAKQTETIHKILMDDTENFDQSDFFMKLIQTFENINFYNLIMQEHKMLKV